VSRLLEVLLVRIVLALPGRSRRTTNWPRARSSGRTSRTSFVGWKPKSPSGIFSADCTRFSLRPSHMLLSVALRGCAGGVAGQPGRRRLADAGAWAPRGREGRTGTRTQPRQRLASSACLLGSPLGLIVARSGGRDAGPDQPRSSLRLATFARLTQAEACGLLPGTSSIEVSAGLGARVALRPAAQGALAFCASGCRRRRRQARAGATSSSCRR